MTEEQNLIRSQVPEIDAPRRKPRETSRNPKIYSGMNTRINTRAKNRSQNSLKNDYNPRNNSRGNSRSGRNKDEGQNQQGGLPCESSNRDTGRRSITRRGGFSPYNSRKAKYEQMPKELKIYPIGGLNEIGKNMTAIEYDKKILIIDCGMTFPEDGMFGIDVVIPDFSFIVDRAKDVVGLILTHGHEDHIGGIPYLLKSVNIPIYGTKFPLGLVENKLKEHDLQGKLIPIEAGEVFNVGPFKVEAIRTTHSIADALCFYIETPAGSLFHTGDFKIDFTPIDGEAFEFARLAEIGSQGVDIMLADSTNVLRKGFTPSERVVGQTLDNIFREAKNRIIIATFSSNVHRVQKIIELAHKYGRKVAVSGRSMENVVALATELGYIDMPANTFVDLNKTSGIPDKELVIITTGSQGEPMSALSRMANDDHKSVKLKKGDMVIFSSTPVPGNEKTVTNVVNKLYEKGVDVIYNDIADIHVSGHACQEELKIMQSLIRPKFFMPVHGEYRHLVQHAKLCEALGKDKDKIFLLENGDCLTVVGDNAFITKGVINAEDVLVDGLGVGDVGNIVLKDRKQLSESGLIVVAATVDRRNGLIISGPELVSRGFVYVKENEELMSEACEVAKEALQAELDEGTWDWTALRGSVREEMKKFIFKKTKRSPIILPIFMEI